MATVMLRPDDFGKRDFLIWTFEIERVDIANLKPLYEMLWRWLNEQGYKDYRTEDDKFEHLYWERVLANGMKEHHVWWRVAKPINDYVRYVVKIDYQTLTMTKAEIAYKGKKKVVDKGDIILRVWLFIQWDWKDKLKNSIFKGLKTTFKSHLYKREMEQHAEDIVVWGYKMHNLIKDYFESETGEQRKPGWYPHKGYINE